MGIQRFGLRMKSYASKVTLGSTNSPAENSIAIIDGPGLAHYIYYSLCDSAFTSTTYQDCANAVIEWLDKLRGYGFRTDSIFFDGALPPSKKDVRIDRLQNYIARLLVFKQSSGTSLSSLTGQTKRTLPPPPFLVFAVVEELLRSEQYSAITYVVPGEADPYCVAAAQAVPLSKDAEITIFSDDSDLLVYEVDSRTRIVPFRDLSELKLASETTLQGEEYRPAEIAKRSGASNKELIKAAYFMSLDYHCSLEKAFRLIASSDLALRDDFLTFAHLFGTAAELQELKLIRSQQDVKVAQASQDSRVSELVYQLQSNSADDSLNGGLRMYLPFLSDDPTRTTAWTVGADIRLLAYSLLLRTHVCDSSVQEYRRSGSRVASSLLEPHTPDESSQLLEHLLREISAAVELIGRGPQLKGEDAWRYLAVQHLLAHLQKEHQPFPALDELTNTVMNRDPWKWHLVHLAAQYQAAYYSLRILQQVLAHATKHAPKQPELGKCSALHEQLRSLPRISVFFDDRARADRRVEQEAWRSLLPALLSELDVDMESNGRTPSKSRKRAKKNRDKQPQDSKLAKNPFAMLVD